jgi:hypothetical protein
MWKEKAMTERSYEDAVQLLKRRMGGQWQGLEADGRDEMVRILRDELGYNSAQADDTIDVMIKTGQIRYSAATDMRGEPNSDRATDTADGLPVVPPVPLVPSATSTPATGALGGAAAVPTANYGPGFWQIGSEGASEVDETPGRAGQVDPTA